MLPSLRRARGSRPTVSRVYACLTQQHEPALVLLAALICLFASHTALSLLERAGASADRTRKIWLGGAACAAGSGIWATHFVAMLAFRPGLPLGYDLDLTALSLVVAIVLTGVGFTLATAASHRTQLLLAGVVVGIGIGAMHYTGMAGLRVPARMTYDGVLVAASIAIGTILAAGALWLTLRSPDRRHRLGGVGLLTLAICGLHFTAMGALRLIPDPRVPFAESALPADWLALVVSLVALLILALGFASAVFDQRLARRLAQEAERLRESEARFRDLAAATFEGIVIHSAGRILDGNPALARLLGRDLDELVGTRLIAHVAPEDRDTLNQRSDERAAEPYEIELVRADGAVLAVEVLERPIRYHGRAARVAALRDLTERKRAEASIHHLAHHDGLTGLPNRVLFRDRLEQAMAGARRAGRTVALLCLDLDRFKAINDLFGHPVGDGLLRQVTARLQDNLRETDTLARLGGDEFAIVQPDLEAPEGAAGLAGRLVATIAEPFEVEGHELRVGLSIGIAFFPGDASDPDEILKQADIALYRAKTEGRGRYRLFEPDMDARLQARRALEQDLRQALAEDRLELHYQPQADAHSRRIVGFEALLRWTHPKRGPIGPAEFIPIAEESGLILPLGEWVLHTACAAAADWPPPVRVAVNVSPAQFRHGELPELVANALHASGLGAERLELEITEDVLLSDTDQTLATLQRLKALGVRISMDDFGTGYSSLGYLRRFAFDRIKIDRSFIQNAGTHPQAAAIVRAVIGLGHNLHMTVTAEGVETAAQLELLRGERCHEIQGFLIGHPMPPDAVADLLAAEAKALDFLTPVPAA